ncbi:restriction endonuclease subunit S [Pseudoalteromonas atlantica]|uniref:restriction endonuclease subunit S n=1 Tax=Pseudoalteromonas atlantica TaxID=288 RepID=UPI003A96D89E
MKILNRKVHPKIRFESEVVNDYPSWGKQPLGKIILKMSSGLSRQLKTENVGLAVIRSNNMADKYTTNKDIKYWYEDDPQGANTSNYILEEGDILVNFINSLSQIGKTSLFRKLPNTNAIYTTNILRLKLNPSQVNELFFFYFTKTVTFETYIRAITKPAVNQASFTTKEFVQLEVPLPCLQEQQKIADFLTSVDTKTSQLTEKYRLLKDYKKGVIQQIFNQQIRFKDDDGNAFPDWEDKLLGDIATFTKGKGISKADISIDGMTPCIRYGELYTTYGEVIESVVSATNLPIKSLLFSEVNDVIVPSSGETQWDIATAACVKLSDVAYSGDLTVIRSPLNGVFLSYYFNSAKKREIASLSQGSSVIHLYSTHLKSLKIEVPCEAEQQKIAQFLQSLDKKIDAVNEQIEQTKLFKKGLLQQMFV